MTDLFDEEEIRALWWKEPFASLMLHGKIETRVWPTSYRGKVLICASKQPYTEPQILNIAGFKQCFRIDKTLTDKTGIQKTFGHAIAIGTLIECRAMTPLDEEKCYVQYQEPWIEKTIGKKSHKLIVKQKRLYCHVYSNVQRIVPFPFDGAQGWKILNREQKEKIVLL